MFPLLLFTVVDVPCYAGCAVSRRFAVFGHADDMPVVGVVLQKVRSCSSLVVFDISVVVGAGSFGPDCSDVLRGRRLGYAFRVGPTGVGRVFLVFSPVPGAGSCPAVLHRVHYLVQGVLRAAQGLQTFRLPVPMLSHAYGLLQEFIPVVFDYREHVLRCAGLLFGQGQQGLGDHGVVDGVQAGVRVVWFATNISMP